MSGVNKGLRCYIFNAGERKHQWLVLQGIVQHKAQEYRILRMIAQITQRHAAMGQKSFHAGFVRRQKRDELQCNNVGCVGVFGCSFQVFLLFALTSVRVLNIFLNQLVTVASPNIAELRGRDS